MFIKTNPARRHPPEESWECVVQTAVAQPLPLPSLSEVMTRTDIILDSAARNFSALHTTNEITADSLRAPETILQGPWDNKVDIWAFGCLIFASLSLVVLYSNTQWRVLLVTIGYTGTNTMDIGSPVICETHTYGQIWYAICKKLKIRLVVGNSHNTSSKSGININKVR